MELDFNRLARELYFHIIYDIPKYPSFTEEYLYDQVVLFQELLPMVSLSEQTLAYLQAALPILGYQELLAKSVASAAFEIQIFYSKFQIGQIILHPLLLQNADLYRPN